MKKKFLAGIILVAGIFAGCGTQQPSNEPPKEIKTAAEQLAEKEALKKAEELEKKRELKKYVMEIQPAMDFVDSNWQRGREISDDMSDLERASIIRENMRVLQNNVALLERMQNEIRGVKVPKSAKELAKVNEDLLEAYREGYEDYVDYFGSGGSAGNGVLSAAGNLISTVFSSSEIDRLEKKRKEILASVKGISLEEEIEPAEIVPAENLPDKPAENLPPEPENNSDETAAILTLKTFHESITDGDFLKAFEKFSADRKDKVRLEDWINGFETTVSSKVSDIRVESNDGDRIVLDYALTAEDNPGGVRHFNGTATLVFESGEWKIDRAKNTLIE